MFSSHLTLKCLNLEINTLLNLLITYNLTADELLVVYLTFLARDEEGHPEYFAKWFNNGGSNQLKTIFESLKSKGLIHKDYNPSSYNPNEIEFNKNFLKGWVKNSGELGQELFDAYPPFLSSNGRLLPLKNIAKKFNTLDEFFFAYSSAIKHNPETHKEVMELLEWGKETGNINYGICEFIISQKWIELKYLREHPQEGKIESTFNVYETI